MHIDPVYRRSYNVEPNFCWECYSCVKACPQHAIDVRGFADFAPLGHSVRVRREEANGTISWKIRYRDGRQKTFSFPIRTTAWESIKPPSDYAAPDAAALGSQLLAHEPAGLMVAALPALPPAERK
jgi:adenylylsulfate reductase subunit B